MASGPIISWQIDEETKPWETLFWGAPKSLLQNHCRWWLQPWNSKTLAPWKKSYDKPRQHIKKQRHYFTNKHCLVKTMVFPVVMYGYESWLFKFASHVLDKGWNCQSYGFSSSHIWMWELNHKESWASKNWCFWTVVLNKTLESPLDCCLDWKIKPVHPKGN